MSDEQAASTTGAAEQAERRRTGRPEIVSSALIPLLRASDLARLDVGSAQDAANPPLPASDDLRAMTGVAVSFFLSLLFWVSVALLAWR